jgi:hypothetical protein
MRYKRPSLWRRFLWWLGGDHTNFCWAVMILAALYMAHAVNVAARAGGW